MADLKGRLDAAEAALQPADQVEHIEFHFVTEDTVIDPVSGERRHVRIEVPECDLEYSEWWDGVKTDGTKYRARTVRPKRRPLADHGVIVDRPEML